MPGPAPSVGSTTVRPVPAGEISSDEIGLFLRMKHDEGIIQEILEKAQHDQGLIQIILEKAKEFEFGITSHGELCTSKCENLDGYFKCNKNADGVKTGTWDYCSPEANMTHHGKVG